MEFFLVRHGDARPSSEDPRRPLSERGREEVEVVARPAASRIAVSAIFHSDKLRARETAEIMARFVRPQKGVKEISGLAPDDDPWIAKAELETADAPVMLVGHLPHLARLASLLLTGQSERTMLDFSTATVVCLAFERGAWNFCWSIAPDDLPRS
ncbi:MAG TPA: phosphohistidine phosphatase SixA [Candidatus Binatia bacterium]|jgi:phosphohistidine phosphatase